MAAAAIEIPELAEVVEEILFQVAETPLGKLFKMRKRKTAKKYKHKKKHKRSCTCKHRSVV